MEELGYLILLCGFVSIWGDSVTLEENLALQGTATQSSIYSSIHEAQNAIDGLKYGSGEAAYCSIAVSQSSPWWRLDLLENYKIGTVTITARSDGYVEQTNGAEIRIGNSLENNGNNNPICAVIDNLPLGGTGSYSCNGMEGRYVNVVMTGRVSHLSLCEVEVYETENLALRGTVTQSSMHLNFVAQNAIDGVKYALGIATSCSHTLPQSSPWWRLDLLDNYVVGTVIITVRSDCCNDQTNGAEIRIGNSLENNGNNNPRCAIISNIQVRSSISYFCNGMEGRYVNLVKTGQTACLTLCEVEVYETGKRNIIFLRLKFSSSVDAAAVSDKILNQLQSALALHISDFKLSWTQLPQQEEKHEEERGSCVQHL